MREGDGMPHRETLEAVDEGKIGVAVATLADDYLTTTIDGQLADNVAHYRTLQDAVVALQHGEVVAIMGEGSELEAALAPSKARYAGGLSYVPPEDSAP